MTITITMSDGKSATKVITSEREIALKAWIKSNGPGVPPLAKQAEGSLRKWLLSELEALMSSSFLEPFITSQKIVDARKLVADERARIVASLDTLDS